MPAPAASTLDAPQIVQRAFDEANGRWRVDVASISLGGAEVVISHVDDSIRIGDGVALVTTTTIASDVGLDVNVIGGTLSGTFTPSGLGQGIRTRSILVTDVATPIPAVAYADRNTLSIRVWGTENVYFGQSSVIVGSSGAPNSGYPKMQFEEIIADVQAGSVVVMYGICETGKSCEVRVMEIG